jgi:2-keto-4-pentenoate hydratase/2-oxohepta-3-ene-1,7-dioic acid hydratase in catechol pathway
MKSDRRSFLKTSGALGGALLAGGTGSAQLAQAQAPQAQPRAPGGMVQGFTFCTLRKGDATTLGIKTEKGILDVAAAEAALKTGAPTTITAVLAGKGDAASLKALVDKAQPAHFVAESAAAFGPCVTEPEKILCVGLNYRKHAAETNNPVPKAPILFNKFNTALNYHNGEIAVSKETKGDQFDYEAELVIVIGKTARNVAEADALKYVFGYCTGNDFTARDLQRQSSQWMLGKALDGSGPIGPWLVTADLVDGDNLKIECHVNGEVRQSSNTNDLVFNCRQLVSFCSQHFTLKPGDLIFTGTPSGVIAGYPKDKQVWLKKGDKVVTTIEKLGALSFTLT